MPVKLLGPTDIRQLAAQLELHPTKKWGQNFVVDAGTVSRIVRKTGLAAGTSVVEIGPGLGSLTLALLAADMEVTAVEIDPRLAAQLPNTISKFAPGKQVQVINADALVITELPSPVTAMVANLPYNVSVPVILHFLELFPNLATMMVMVQSEVAERLAAPPGSRTYGVPSAKAAWYCQVRLAGSVGRAAFWPVPRVDSSLVLLERRQAPVSAVSRARVFAVIDAAFAQRRKGLRGALSPLVGASRVDDVLAIAKIDPLQRGEKLGIEQFVNLAEAWDQVEHA